MLFPCEGYISFIPCVDRNKAIYLIFKCIFIKVESCVVQTGLEHLVFLTLYIHNFSHSCDQIPEEVCFVSHFEGARSLTAGRMITGGSMVGGACSICLLLAEQEAELGQKAGQDYKSHPSPINDPVPPVRPHLPKDQKIFQSNATR